jgi:hypothetical protein
LVSLGTVIMVHWSLARSQCNFVRLVGLSNGMMKDLSVAGFGISDFTWKALTFFVMQTRGKAQEESPRFQPAMGSKFTSARIQDMRQSTA